MRSLPQLPLPLFPARTTHLSEHLALECHAGQVTDFNGHLTVFTRAQGDPAAFGLCAGQVVVNGSASPDNIPHASGVRQVAVPRAVDEYRARGAVAFCQWQNVESQGYPPALLAGWVGVRRAAPRHSAKRVGQVLR